MDKDFLYKEYTALRDELHNLKTCQVIFLTSSITATGVILGLFTKLGSSSFIGAFYLTPLIILLPAWWVFFDKATTITRIVGYVRILERTILGKTIINSSSICCYSGWENAIAKFRQFLSVGQLKLDGKNNDKGPTIRFSKIFKIFFIFTTTNRYWVLTYYVFFGLSLLCFILSLSSMKFLTPTLIAVVSIAGFVFLTSAIWNAIIVWQLIEGHHSYNANEKLWNKILK